MLENNIFGGLSISAGDANKNARKCKIPLGIFQNLWYTYTCSLFRPLLFHADSMQKVMIAIKRRFKIIFVHNETLAERWAPRRETKGELQ